MITGKIKHKVTILLLLVFALIFSLISIVNHLNYRTFGLDLGVFNHTLYHYATFNSNNYSILENLFHHPLADHFSLITPIVSPLYWILGTYTMLILQILFILLGGIGVYRYFLFKSGDKLLANLAMLHMFMIWGIYSALAFDYHDNVCAAMMVPWFILYFEKQKWLPAIFFFTVILITKENMALWAVFIGLGLVVANLKNRAQAYRAAGFTGFALIYFVVVIKFLMPAFSDGVSYHHFKYSSLGATGYEAIETVITRPWYAFQLLFVNHLDDPIADGIKKELHIMVLLSGGLALLFKPQYLIMLLPIYAQKLYSDDFGKWGINLQYSIEFVPILTIALFNLLLEIPYKKIIPYMAILAILICGKATLDKLESRVSLWYNPLASNFLIKEHYEVDFDKKKLKEALGLIPPNAVVSATSRLVPHLAFRDRIYHFPDLKSSEYIIILDREFWYPFNQEQLTAEIKKFKHDPDWKLVYEENFTYIFRKNL